MLDDPSLDDDGAFDDVLFDDDRRRPFDNAPLEDGGVGRRLGEERQRLVRAARRPVGTALAGQQPLQLERQPMSSSTTRM
jgi:hypothetical protein